MHFISDKIWYYPIIYDESGIYWKCLGDCLISCCAKLTACNGLLPVEIRPAPHMDNLVSVFKSMEVAAGTSIVATPLAPSPKVAGIYNLFFCFVVMSKI